ncbi:MAG: amino acid ABC transporter permease, partial [Clostridia bacterium]
MEAFYSFLQSSDLGTQIYETLFYANRWIWYVDGLIMTLKLTVGAILVGTVLGIIAAIFSISNFKLLRFISKVYTTIIRGTPSTVQLLIMYNVILVSTTNKLLVGILAFGINSGAYVAELLRGGIVSVDKGQTEAGRSLGLHSWQTMMYIVLPQA